MLIAAMKSTTQRLQQTNAKTHNKPHAIDVAAKIKHLLKCHKQKNNAIDFERSE
jgi:hypothetical protein